MFAWVVREKMMYSSYEIWENVERYDYFEITKMRKLHSTIASFRSLILDHLRATLYYIYRSTIHLDEFTDVLKSMKIWIYCKVETVCDEILSNNFEIRFVHCMKKINAYAVTPNWVSYVELCTYYHLFVTRTQFRIACLCTINLSRWYQLLMNINSVVYRFMLSADRPPSLWWFIQIDGRNIT